MSGRSAATSLTVHALLAALILATPAADDRPLRRFARAVELELETAAAPEVRARAPTAEPEPELRAPTAEPEPELRARARRPTAEPELRARRPTAEPELRVVTPEPEGETAPGPEPPRRFVPFDAVALAAAIEPATARATRAGTTVRGAPSDEGGADDAAVDAVRAMTEELRERAQAGRPEAAGVVTYFQDTRRRLAAAWAPRTAHLPSRTKAMIQSMQAVNRAALDMMEGRSERARAAQIDGRVTPDEWRDAMREAAQRARAVNSAIVAVVHDATGRVIDVRITRSSGHEDLDRSVLTAARETLGQEPAPPMPPVGDSAASRRGGRVARYRFDVLMTAIPPVPPVVGVTFDESRGTFRVFYPGQINWRLNVVFLGARYGTDVRPQSREAE